MPRALWSGSLSFGLVNVPVALVPATRDVDLHFRQIHAKDGSPVEIRRFCEQEDREIPYDELAHGFERDDGALVVLSDDELASVAPERTRTIEVQAFVDLAAVDPVFFDAHYLVAPIGAGEGPRRAYRLLLEVMRRTERAALARFVLRTREHLALVRVRDELLVLTTMVFADEVRDPEGIAPGGKVAKAQLEHAAQLVEALSADWDPSRYEDRHRARLRDVVERKKQGKRITMPKQEDQPAPVPDLMAALQRSLEAARKGGGKGEKRAADGDDLESLSKDELYERAQKADVPGRSSMSKDELVSALRD